MDTAILIMKIIAHRGLLHGPNRDIENSPTQIDLALKEFHVEIDVWYIDRRWWLCHDYPNAIPDAADRNIHQLGVAYEIDLKWILDRMDRLWIHCKNTRALVELKKLGLPMNYFWHEHDTVTLTSRGFIWAYPGKQPIADSVAVLPEIHSDVVDQCYGVCTDYPYRYRDRLTVA